MLLQFITIRALENFLLAGLNCLRGDTWQLRHAHTDSMAYVQADVGILQMYEYSRVQVTSFQPGTSSHDGVGPI